MPEPPKSDLPILLLGALDSIRTTARFQKMAFLSDMEVYGGTKYSDWRPRSYGPFSDDLKNDVDLCVGAGLIRSGYVIHPVSQKPVPLLSLTPEGRSEFESILEANRKEIAEIRTRLFQYQFHRTSARLLWYIYENHEEYTTKSLIGDKLPENTGSLAPCLEYCGSCPSTARGGPQRNNN